MPSRFVGKRIMVYFVGDHGLWLRRLKNIRLFLHFLLQEIVVCSDAIVPIICNTFSYHISIHRSTLHQRNDLLIYFKPTASYNRSFCYVTFGNLVVPSTLTDLFD